MRKQRGVALSGLLFWAIVIGLVSVLGMKVTPDCLDYFKAVKSIKAVAGQSAGRTVPEIRNAFDRYAEVNQISAVKGVDLDISKEGDRAIISFAYEKRIHLFYNVSLLIDFQGSSSGN